MIGFVSKSRWLALALAAACGSGSGGGGDDTPGQPDASVQEPMINGLPASQFYAQFAHQTTMTNVAGAAAFPETGGNNAYLVHFFLMPAGSLQLFYAEGNGTVSTTGWSLNLDSSTKKKRSGTWRVEGAKLVLDALMSCDGLQLNNQPALNCTLTATIVTPAAQGRSGTFKKDIGPSSPNDSEFADYQP